MSVYAGLPYSAIIRSIGRFSRQQIAFLAQLHVQKDVRAIGRGQLRTARCLQARQLVEQTRSYEGDWFRLTADGRAVCQALAAHAKAVADVQAGRPDRAFNRLAKVSR